MSRVQAIQNERERQAKPEYEKPPAMHAF